MQAFAVTAGNCLLCIVDVLLGQLGSVEPVAPAQVLPDEGDGHGRLVWIQLGHVQIIHKVDELFCAWWPIVDASLCKIQQFVKVMLVSATTQETKTQKCTQQNTKVAEVELGAKPVLTFFSRGDSRIFWNEMTSVK